MTSEIVGAAQQLDRAVSMPITAKELVEATRAAQNKLKAIIEAEGDADGIRLENWYLAELVTEELRSRRMSGFTTAAAQLFTAMTAKGQKETTGATNTKPPTYKNNLASIVA